MYSSCWMRGENQFQHYTGWPVGDYCGSCKNPTTATRTLRGGETRLHDDSIDAAARLLPIHFQLFHFIFICVHSLSLSLSLTCPLLTHHSSFITGRQSGSTRTNQTRKMLTCLAFGFCGGSEIRMLLFRFECGCSTGRYLGAIKR